MPSDRTRVPLTPRPAARRPDPPSGDPRVPVLADFASVNARMAAFLDLVERVRASDVTLLIRGETGVGKEHLARAIHVASPRATGPFVSVNCAALPDSLLESELFGHEAGAFTGAARRRRGRFESADGGTILLDEIGEMPPHLQVKLLTVLQRRMVQRIGSDRPVPIDVRVMAATHRDLAQEVARGRLREDLYYRLNVVELAVPALRERPEDIPRLAQSHFAELRARRPEIEALGDDVLSALVAYPWPGNVRELHNVLERAVLLTHPPRVVLNDLPEAVRRGAPSVPALARTPTDPFADLLELPLRQARERLLERFERAYLEALLTRTRGRMQRAATLAGITPRSLYDRLQRRGLRKEEYRT